MEIKKKRLGNVALVELEGKVFTVNDIDDEKWKDLLFHIEEYKDEPSDFNKQILMTLLHPREAEKQKLKKEQEEKAKLEFESKQYEIHERKRKSIRIVSAFGEMFEVDEEGLVYLTGYKTPIPKLLCDKLLDAKYNPNSKFSVNSLVNFWKWTLLNPNPKAQSDLFDWFAKGDFSITEQGMIVAYRCVDIKKKSDKRELHEFVHQQYLKIKKQKKSPKNYIVIKVKGEYKLEHEQPHKVPGKVGNLLNLYENAIAADDDTVYTDHHTKSMHIKMGVPVSLPIEVCDTDENAQCSAGLHGMAPSYGLRYGEVAIMILVNPKSLIAFPSYDKTKFRC